MPISNEREMIYVSLDKITDPQVKKILAHEFMHLIAFNQKNQINGVEEDTWLNEARADYSSTVLGYDDVYDRSNLQARVHDFIENPSYSLTDWQGTKYNYATASMFTHYLVDQYGINILTDSLKSKYIGIASINYALQKAGFKDDFSKIFSNWTVTVVLNDCSGNTRYCYLNANLKNLKILPSLNFLPLTGNVSLSVSNVTQNWTGNWIKFIGGSGDLKINFSSLVGLNFQVPYILQDSGGTYAVSFFRIDSNEKGEINIPEFGTDYKSLTIIPSLQSQQMSDVTGANYPYTYAIYIAGSQPVGDQDLIKQLLERIAALKQEIAELQKQKGTAQSCSQFYSDLYFGMSGVQVSCLQNFLKRQGADIYPEGYVTGNFGSLTEAAVIKFQEKYASDILTPIGFSKGSGYVGSRTRAKINQILSGK
jgi:peptidoglycan hydrolase-like protein with peptidoglycan-binding domain